MSRPIYETEKDLTREKSIGKVLAKVWKAELHKLPRSYYVDWLITRNNQVKAFAELKCRSNNRRQYPSLILSLHKWIHGKQLAAEVSGEFLIIVQWKDGLFYFKESGLAVSYGFGGRKDRGDDQDMEPVVNIPVDYFKEIIG
jgi:hypothetical protein